MMPSSFTFYNQSSNSSCTKYDSSTCLLESCLSFKEDTAVLGNQMITSNQIQLRFLNPNDYDTVKVLCEEWFPVEYPSSWFEAITSNPKFFSLAAVLDGQIIGLIVSELRAGRLLWGEDRDLLAKSQLKKYSVAYILSLGVVGPFRRHGIASLLLSSLLNHLSTLECKAVYLHVLSSNEAAIRFYEKHKFQVYKFLPYYYSVGGRGLDGFAYVLYINHGHGPWGIHDYVFYIWQVVMNEFCSLPHWCLSQVRRIAQSMIAFVR